MVLNIMGERIEDKRYLGHGDFDMRRGWLIYKRWYVWFDKDYG